MNISIVLYLIFLFTVNLGKGRRYGYENVGLKTKRDRCFLPDGATQVI